MKKMVLIKLYFAWSRLRSSLKPKIDAEEIMSLILGQEVFPERFGHVAAGDRNLKLMTYHSPKQFCPSTRTNTYTTVSMRIPIR